MLRPAMISVVTIPIRIPDTQTTGSTGTNETFPCFTFL